MAELHTIEVGAARVSVHTCAAPHIVRLAVGRCDGTSQTTGAVLRGAVAWAFEAGYTRVEMHCAPADSDVIAAATAAGLRREGVLRGAAEGGGDVVALGRLADDVSPDVDRLPTIASWFHLRSVASGVVVRSQDGRVLLLQPSYKPEWEIPGGLVEAGEELLATARRECVEELGLELPVGGLLAVAYTPANTRRPDTVAFVFDGGVHHVSLVDRVRFHDGEILSVAWCDRDEVARLASPPLARRVLAILDAFDAGTLPGPALILGGPPEPNPDEPA